MGSNLFNLSSYLLFFIHTSTTFFQNLFLISSEPFNSPVLILLLKRSGSGVLEIDHFAQCVIQKLRDDREWCIGCNTSFLGLIEKNSLEIE